MSLARREVKDISHVIRVNVIPSGDVMIGLLDNIKSGWTWVGRAIE